MSAGLGMAAAEYKRPAGRLNCRRRHTSGPAGRAVLASARPARVGAGGGWSDGQNKPSYVCGSCGARTPQWQGQCPACQAWNTLELAASALPFQGRRAAAPAAAAASRTVTEITQETEVRAVSGIGELDRVLGGGLVAGSVILLGGDPGIGKSTLLLQAADALSRDRPVLYASGEESVRQVALRARRLGLESATLRLAAETRVEAILEEALAARAAVLVVDSIQTMHTELSESSPGSAVQVRESAARLVRFAQGHRHDRADHRPRDQGRPDRRARASSSTWSTPCSISRATPAAASAWCARSRTASAQPTRSACSRWPSRACGRCAIRPRCSCRGPRWPCRAAWSRWRARAAVRCWSSCRRWSTRRQGLSPRRVAVGFEGGRLALLLAVLHRHGGIATAGQDVFVNVVGGVRISETAADLPAVLAVLSSLRNRPVAHDTVCFGELGLTGEVRPVPFGEERLREAAKQGFRRALVPAGERAAPRRSTASR